MQSLNFLKELCDEAYDKGFIERSEELANVISDLKDSLGIPHFNTEWEDKRFCSAFLAKKDYLQEERDNDPIMQQAIEFYKSIGHNV